MEPFRIICETCRSRLKIRDARVIGEIHACPKCGSMVEIRPPAGGTAPVLSKPGEASIVIGGSLPTFDGVSETLTLTATTIPAQPESIDAPSAGETIPAATAGAAGSVALLLWGIGAVAVLTVGGLLAALWLNGKRADAQPATSENTAQQVAKDTVHVTEPAAPKVETSNPKEAAPPATANSDNTGSDDTSKQVAKTDAPAAVEQATALPELPPIDSKPAASDSPPIADAKSAAPPSASASAAALPAAPPAANVHRVSPVMKFDPLDFDPTQLSFNPDDSANAAGEANSIPANQELPAQGPNDKGNDVAAKEAPPIPAVDHTLNVRLGPIPKTPVSPQRTAHQLATHINSLTVSEMPLSRFVDLVTNLTDVGVTLDPRELALAGVSPRQLVSADVKDSTAEQLLRDVFSKNRLEFVDRDGDALALLAGGDKHLEVDYDVADLTAGGDAKAIAQLVERFVAPTTWKEAGGTGTIRAEGTKLRIAQSQRVRHEMLIFIERLRLARNLSQRSRYPATLLATTSPYASAAPKLQQRATFTFLPWTRLADVVRHLQDASHMTVLVDWSALADAELSPSSPIACSAIDRTWQDAFDGVLSPVGLAWWAVDGETIQITTVDALDNIRTVEFHEVPKPMRDQFASGPALIESLQAELSKLQNESQAAFSDAVVELDNPSGRLIVLGTPAIHRLLTEQLDREPKQPLSRNP